MPKAEFRGSANHSEREEAVEPHRGHYECQTTEDGRKQRDEALLEKHGVDLFSEGSDFEKRKGGIDPQDMFPHSFDDRTDRAIYSDVQDHLPPAGTCLEEGEIHHRFDIPSEVGIL